MADYERIAPRYGSNDDLVELVAKAKERGIRVLLDLVVGHTSDEHEWFQAELAADGPSPEGNCYIWTTQDPGDGWGIDLPGIPAWVRPPGPRPGWYLKNFYDSQPALNFGWVDTDPRQPWRDAIDAPGPLRNRQALHNILEFWLSKGMAGSRVDMAFSVVKDEHITQGSRTSTSRKAARRPRGSGRASGSGWARHTRTRCSSPRATNRRWAASSPSTPTSRW